MQLLDFFTLRFEGLLMLTFALVFAMLLLVTLHAPLVLLLLSVKVGVVYS
jgi:hypothetical protein